ncbi:MlaD family protein [Synechococcus sp. BS56D]|uniref:MlaD family protein n=1 Tax=Synechococcus sp. BS56D TaxID=2055944 RepID=UPI0019D005B6|nr:MlaD family protein [Synechococcus sp. BS56D]
MRRSVREAIVGFSIVGAVAAFAGTMLWLRGVRLGAETWTVTVDFADAGGLAERSPVTYRGILVGVVKNIQVTPQAVRATLEIDQEDLRLPLPVSASVGAASLLGGDAQVNLVSRGKPLGANAPLPKSRNCAGSGVLCNGAAIRGQQAASLDSVTASLQRLLSQAEKEKLVSRLVESTDEFDATAQDIQKLIQQLSAELERAEPTINNLNQATDDAAKAAAHIRNLAAALDNPKTVSELKRTVSNAESLTRKIDTVGGDVEKLTSDPKFMKAVRDVTIGLGAFFQELYPAQTGKP